MTTAVGDVRPRAIDHRDPASATPTLGDSSSPGSLLPRPEAETASAEMDVMGLLYALTAKARDRDTRTRSATAKEKGEERTAELAREREEAAKAKEAKDDGGWLDAIAGAIDSVADAVVGGNPLQDLAHSLSEATGVKAFDVAYDLLRPDALLHAAACLTSAAPGCEGVSQTCDARPWEAPKAGGAASLQGDGPSLKTRFQGAADATGEPAVMDAYTATRDTLATSMVTVGTCGVGTVALVAVASSAALAAESKLDLLGKAGVSNETKTWIRIGGQAAVVLGTGAASLASKTSLASSGAKAAMNIGSGGSQAGRGAVTAGRSMYEHAASEHLTLAATHEVATASLAREQERIVSGLQEATKSYARCLETLAGAIHERDQAPLLLAKQFA